MTKKNFISILKYYYEISESIHELYSIGFDISDNPKFPIQNLVFSMFDEIMKTKYNEEGLDWITWYIFEYSPYNKEDSEEWMYPKREPAAWDADKNPICFNIDVLYDYVNEHCRCKKK
jgi:hypothetical protein